MLIINDDSGLLTSDTAPNNTHFVRHTTDHRILLRQFIYTAVAMTRYVTPPSPVVTATNEIPGTVCMHHTSLGFNFLVFVMVMPKSKDLSNSGPTPKQQIFCRL